MIATAWLLGVRASALASEGPEPEDVKAGWTAFALFGLLAVAVVVLGRSLVVQLRKAQRAADAGVYGEPERPRTRPGPGSAPGSEQGSAHGSEHGSEHGPEQGPEQGPDPGRGGGTGGGADTPGGGHPTR